MTTRILCFALLLLVTVASRGLWIHAPEMPLTGDECVVGLMGKHLAEGRGTSLYFYGQHYGLAIVEAAAAAAFYPALGVSAAAVRSGMLVLLALAVILLHIGLTTITDRKAGGLGVLLLLTLPPWTLWSLQARGGYVTALLGACAVLAAVSRAEAGGRGGAWLLAVAASAITILAKSSWLPGLLPILLLVPLRRRNVRLGIALLVAVAILGLGGHLAGVRLTENYWQGPAISLGAVVPNLRQLPALLHYQFTTDLFSAGADNLLYRIVGTAWLCALPVGLGIQVWRMATRTYSPWSHALCLSTVGSLAALLLVPLLPRYLLSVSFFLVLWLVVEFANLPHRRLAGTLAIIVILLGAGGILMDRGSSEEALTEPAIEELIELLDGENIRHVYCTDPLMQWMVAFYSNESITCRWTPPDDRLPALPRAVDHALRAGEPVAIIGMLGHLGRLADPDAGIDVYSFPGQPFFIAPHPTPEILEANGFILNGP